MQVPNVKVFAPPLVTSSEPMDVNEGIPNPKTFFSLGQSWGLVLLVGTYSHNESTKSHVTINNCASKSSHVIMLSRSRKLQKHQNQSVLQKLDLLGRCTAPGWSIDSQHRGTKGGPWLAQGQKNLRNADMYIWILNCLSKSINLLLYVYVSIHEYINMYAYGKTNNHACVIAHYMKIHVITC